MKRIVHLMFGLALVASVAFVAWFARDLEARKWKSDQHMHIRWNATCFSEQYERIDRLGDENLRRDYVTNFCRNACILLNLHVFETWYMIVMTVVVVVMTLFSAVDYFRKNRSVFATM